MAKSSKSRKISRRDAVVLLGTGVLVARGKGASARRAEGAQQPPGRPDRCKDDAVVVPYEFRIGSEVHQAMLAFTCCRESQNAILVGVAEPQKTVSNNGQRHLKPMTERLKVDRLDEYCFMIWGLTDAQNKMLLESMPKTLGLTLRVNPKAK